MSPQDKPEFVRILVGLSAMKPGKELTSEVFDLYWSALSDWSLADFRAAANHLARSSEFMPNPYHFDQLAKQARRTNADASWEQIITNHGQTDDPVAARSLRSLGGWRVIGFSESTRLPWLKERFKEAYQSFANSAEAVAALPSAGPSRAVDAARQLAQQKRLRSE